MPWITIIWSMNAGMCLAIGLFRLRVWTRDRRNGADLAVAVSALAMCAGTLVELAAMQAKTPEALGELLRWSHVTVGVSVVGLVWFVRFFLQAGPLWLVWLNTGLRALILVLTFALTPNLSYRSITGLQEFSVFNEVLVQPIGEKHPWADIHPLSALLLFCFSMVASYQAWRAGRKRRAVVVSATFGVVMAIGTVGAEWLHMHRGALPPPYSFLFLFIFIGIAIEYGFDAAAQRRAEREVQLQRRELAHLQRVASMGQMASGLAHEVFQPLGAILRNAEAAELSLQQDLPDLRELQVILADINLDGQRAGAIIQRVRQQLRRRSPQMEAFALPELLEQTCSLLQGEFHARVVEPVIRMPDELPEVWGDRVQVQQVLLVLALNALDACGPVDREEEDMPRVEVEAGEGEEGQVWIRVRDFGAGIATEELDQLFTPFHTTKASGLGMGLCIAQTIVLEHEGRIWGENCPDGGAAFTFTLRRAESAAELA